jgi:myo-inositol-1(or 4)-monophosphatase
MTYSTFYRISNEIAEAIESVIAGLIGKTIAGVTVRMGADGTPTEMIDEIAEYAALSVLESKSMSLRLVSEELGERVIGEEPEITIVLDPMDGTFNAIKNIPFFCVSIGIGYSDLSDIRFGYVKNLVNGNIYTAEKGSGAYLNNNKKLHVSSVSKLSDSNVISYSHSPYAITVSHHKVRRVRVFGSAALELCYIASGKFDAFIDTRSMLRVTDIAAGKVIVEEAGGKLTDGNGEALTTPLDVKQRVNVVASNGYIHDKILELV